MKKLLGLFLVFFVGLNGWGQYNNSGIFTKITSLSNLTDGYYVIVNSDDDFAMNNTHTTFLANTSISPVNSTITNPSSDIVWKIELNGGGYTIFNNNISKYISYTGSSNNLQITSTVTTNNQRWTISYSSNVFSFVNLQLNTRILQYNSSSPRFACYASAQQKLLLYKLNPTITGAATTSPFTTTEGTASSAQNFSISGANLTANLIATAPTGFEVSSDGTTYGATATFTQSSGSASGTLSIRIAASATAGNYDSQNIVLSSTGATNVSISTPASGNTVSSPLPIELITFAANCADNNTVSVNWTTASEHNSDYYTVEKSRDGIAWNILATKAATGNSTQLINYSVKDYSNISGTVYYRLTQVDVDGASKMYDIVSTSCSSESELSLIAYPNPSDGQFTVKIENALGGKYDLAITDMQGKAIEEQSFDLETGTTVVKLNPANILPGVYLLQFMQDGKPIQQQKLIIE